MLTSADKLEFSVPTDEALLFIAENMRESDRREVWASHNHTPFQSVMAGVRLPGYSTIVSAKGVPLVVLGLVKPAILSRQGVPWMLGTDLASIFKKAFLILGRQTIKEMFNHCDHLCNYVHVDNKNSIQWLRRLGFTFDDPAPYGVRGELFHKFYMGKEDV